MSEPGSCKLCKRKDRAVIDARILSEPARPLAAELEISRTTIDKHRAHITTKVAEGVAAVRQEQAIEVGTTVLARLAELTRETREILQRHARPDDEGYDAEICLKAITRLEKQLELEAKIAGELKDNQVTVTLGADWVALRTAILGALEAHPEARAAVMSAMSGEAAHAVH